MTNLSDKSRLQAEYIIKGEIASMSSNPDTIKQNGCAACHVLFKVKESLQISEQDAADLLSEVLLDNPQLNDGFISLIENIHLKSRMMGINFVIKTRQAKDRYIEANFKNTLNELQADASVYGTEIVMRKLVLSNMAINIAQNLGIDYHAATEELYYYMRKNDMETHNELMQLIRSVMNKAIKK